MAVRFARDGCSTGGGNDATGVNTLWKGGDLLFLPLRRASPHQLG